MDALNGQKLKYHEDLCNQMHKLYIDKNADYGNSASRTYQEFGMLAFAVRISDKFNRFVNLTKKGIQNVKDESIEDTLIDMANYCLLAVIELRCERDKHDKETIFVQEYSPFMTHDLVKRQNLINTNTISDSTKTPTRLTTTNSANG